MTKYLIGIACTLLISIAAMATGAGTHNDPKVQDGRLLETPIIDGHYSSGLTCYTQRLLFFSNDPEATINIDGQIQGLTAKANHSIFLEAGTHLITLVEGKNTKTFPLTLVLDVNAKFLTTCELKFSNN